MYASLLAKFLVALVGIAHRRCTRCYAICQAVRAIFLLLYMQNNLWTLLLVSWAVTLMISDWSRNLFIWIVLLAECYLPYCLYQLVTQFCAVFFSPNFCLCYFTCFFPTMLGIFWEHAIEVNLSALIVIILPKQTQSCNMGEFKCSIIERTLKLCCVEKGSRSPVTRIWFVLKRKILTNTQEL